MSGEPVVQSVRPRHCASTHEGAKPPAPNWEVVNSMFGRRVRGWAWSGGVSEKPTQAPASLPPPGPPMRPAAARPHAGRTPPPRRPRPPRAAPEFASDAAAPYSYVSADGRRKATIQDAGPMPTGNVAAAPWELGFQLSERNGALWSSLKRRLVAHAAAREAGMTEEEMGDALRRLATLLGPEFGARLPTLPPALLASLAASPAAVADGVLALRSALPPPCDVGAMVARAPGLALSPPPAAVLADAVASLAATLETDPRTIRRLLSHHPDLLDVAGVRAAVAEGRRVLGAAFAVSSIVADPRTRFKFQAGDLLIPYDQYDAGSPEATGGDGGSGVERGGGG